MSRVVAISPGQGQGRALFEEDSQVIRESLEDAYALQEFSVLLCDQVGQDLVVQVTLRCSRFQARVEESSLWRPLPASARSTTSLWWSTAPRAASCFSALRRNKSSTGLTSLS